MKYLEPKKIQVQAVTAISHQRMDEDETRERQLFLGFFDPEISKEAISNALTEHNLWNRVLTVASFGGQEEARLVAMLRPITEGIVFESVEEFVQCLSKGLRYDDIAEGYSMAHQELGVERV